MQLDDLPDLVCWLQGPILFTAPHSITLPAVHRKMHIREYGTGQLAISLTKHLCQAGKSSCGSFMVWNSAAPDNPSRLDPNYLPVDRSSDSEWHRALRRWKCVAGNAAVPLLHVDLHGKISDELFVDVGCAALERLWPRRHQAFVTAFKCRLGEALDLSLKRCDARGPRGCAITAQTDPRLDGFRGSGFMTMSMQAAMLGVPSVQLEFPSLLRERLVTDSNLCALIADSILNVFETIVTPWTFGQQFTEQAADLSLKSFSIYGGNQRPGVNDTDADDMFALLGGMIVITEDLPSCDCDDGPLLCDDIFPATDARDDWKSEVVESGPSDISSFVEWAQTLLKLFVQWELTEGLEKAYI